MIFVDASALVAILKDEPERARVERVLLAETDVHTSPLAVWEAVRALLKERHDDPVLARGRVHRLLLAMGVEVRGIGAAEGELALNAHARFGKGRHPARLNLGDCFAYACAQTSDSALLFVGEDFTLTDIVAA